MKEIVIKIPDEVLSFVYQNGFIEEKDRKTVHHAILECVELPKGHGRLIDADALKDSYCNSNAYTNEKGFWFYSVKDIMGATTIIEADKEEE